MALPPSLPCFCRSLPPLPCISLYRSLSPSVSPSLASPSISVSPLPILPPLRPSTINGSALLKQRASVVRHIPPAHACADTSTFPAVAEGVTCLQEQSPPGNTPPDLAALFRRKSILRGIKGKRRIGLASANIGLRRGWSTHIKGLPPRPPRRCRM